MRAPLTPDDRRRLEDLFDLAAKLPQAEQAGFVERECGSNAALREELLRVLAGLRGEDLLDQLRPGIPSRVGARIGPYKLLERIGEGGMGEVYAAEQREPVVRRVALKIIKLGMDSDTVIARFDAERQALARMSHPNIAQVFDGGKTESGSPYLVMEYVAGDPVTDYCDRRKLPTRRRVEIFLGICEGVQHAHQKGIIHRDLKPSNLLVMEQDGSATAKIIDFGVARATSGRLVEHTLHTMLGQIVGTLDYMSPEQADPTSVDIDTRSDVYSLGIVLYQLLSGLLPFEHRLRPELPLSEVQRSIRETNPPTPSTRLRRQRGTATTLAPLHGTDERSLVRQLSGDLDWICMKALEKDPARRYASAAALAEDLGRHMRNEPVLAGRPDALYRARKFVRRNRIGVTAGVLVLAGALAGVAGLIQGRALRPQADSVHAKQLLGRADELWPPTPDRIVEMDEWIREARALGRRRDGYQADLERLRAAAEPRTAEQIRKDRAACPRIGELSKHRVLLAVLEGNDRSTLSDETRSKLERSIQERRAEIAALEVEVEGWRTWRFATLEEQTRHDVLALLVDELRALSDAPQGLLREDGVTPGLGWSVPKRLEFARTVGEQSISGPGAGKLWDAAIAAIAASPRYGGLRLEPQLGLIPIGEDPHSGLWEFAYLQSGAPPERGTDGQVLRTEDGRFALAEDTGLVLVLIPGSTFTMGPPPKEGEQPVQSFGGAVVQEVTLSPYFLSKYEMTQGQWKRLTGTNPSDYGPDGRWETDWLESGAWPSLVHPVEQVSWWDCMKWLPRAGLELPSAAQWECAAKAGMNRTYWWYPSDGSSSWWNLNRWTELQGKVNLFDNYALSHLHDNGEMGAESMKYQLNDGSAVHSAVGTYEPNPFGLFDIHGNVFEWCLDGYDELTRAPTHSDDGRDPWAEWEGMGTRIHRGGSFRLGPGFAGSWIVQIDPPDMRGHALGVRPARKVTNL